MFIQKEMNNTRIKVNVDFVDSVKRLVKWIDYNLVSGITLNTNCVYIILILD